MTAIINDFAKHLSRTKKLAPNTAESYRRDLTSFFKFLEDLEISPYSAGILDIQNYVNNLVDSGKSPSTVARHIASLRAFYLYSLKKKTVKENPTLHITHPALKAKLPSVLSDDEIETLLAAPNTHTSKGLRDKAMLELLYATGIKVSELIALDLNEVNLSASAIICKSSTKSRPIPIYRGCKVLLEKYINTIRRGAPSEKAVFLNSSGKRISRQAFWKIVKQYAEISGIQKDISANTLRHSFATHLLQNGADIHDVQLMLGHNNIKSTRVYSKLVDAKIADSYYKFHPKAK